VSARGIVPVVQESATIGATDVATVQVLQTLALHKLVVVQLLLSEQDAKQVPLAAPVAMSQDDDPTHSAEVAQVETNEHLPAESQVPTWAVSP